VEEAFKIVGLDWKRYVKVDKRFLRIIDVDFLQGDYSKAKGKLRWEPQVKFKKLIQIMVEEDLNRWQRWLKGERFPWDAYNYPEEANILTRSLRY
jgi:GDPmannose 4,6-dehydratase